MKQYMLAVHTDYDAPFDPEVMERSMKAVDVFNNELQSTGAWVFAGGLTPPGSATVIRPAEGDVVTTDGPFAETKEVLGGFWIIKAEDLDAALVWAKKGALACANPVEVRPFQDEPEA
jgi:hypothetical protein